MRCPNQHQHGYVVVPEERSGRYQSIEETKKYYRCEEDDGNLGDVNRQEVGWTVNTGRALPPEDGLVVAKAAKRSKHTGQCNGHAGHAQQERQFLQEDFRVQSTKYSTSNQNKKLIEDQNPKLTQLYEQIYTNA